MAMNRRRFLLSALAAPVIVRASMVAPFVPCPQAPVDALAADFATDDLIVRGAQRFAGLWQDWRAVNASGLSFWARGPLTRASAPSALIEQSFLSGLTGPSSPINAPTA
jgi:hypothetical protein